MNKYILYDNYAEIILCDRRGNEKARALIDLDDIEKVINYSWCLDNSNGCVKNRELGYLHRYVMDACDYEQVDHINHQRKDNRKSNLRLCDNSHNNMNKDKPKNNTSGALGVCWDKSRNKWVAQIGVNGKHFSKRFSTKEEAIKYRKELEEKYFGEFKYQGGND